MTTHLVIPDPHAKWAPNLDLENRRFDALGNLILDQRPDVVVIMGDMGDCVSISRHQKGTRSAEGNRWVHDVEAVRDASRRILAPLKAHNDKQRRTKHTLYQPRLVMLMGNHDEAWINSFVQAHPEMEGWVDLSNFQLEEDGWELVPYRTTAYIDGIGYSHHATAGQSGRPLGGAAIARRLLKMKHTSFTVGHSHIFDIASEVDGTGRRLWGLSTGCFREDNPDYAKDTAQEWWRGVITKTDVADGSYDPSLLSLPTLLKKYL